MGIHGLASLGEGSAAAVKVFSYHTETIALPKRQSHPDFMKTGGAEYGLNEAMMQANSWTAWCRRKPAAPACG